MPTFHKTQITSVLALTLSLQVLSFPVAAADLPTAAPQSQGLSPTRLARIRDVVQSEVNADRMPGAVILVARKGAKRKAQKQAFKNLVTEGIRNYILVSVYGKSGYASYEVMIYISKETGIMHMQEFRFNGPKRKDSTFSEVRIHPNDPRIPNEVREWYR